MVKLLTRSLFILLLLFSGLGGADQLLRQFDAETGVVGQNVPSPLKAVTYNWPTITNEVVQAGTKSYRIYLTNDGSLYGGNVNALYRTEMEGFIENSPPRQIQFDHVYYLRIDFYQTVNGWAPDSSGESWPVQMHEVPVNLASPGTNDWANWGVGTCQQSALSTAPFFINWNNGVMSFRRWGGVELWNTTPAKGQWHKLVIRIKVSRNSGGFVQSWLDGVSKPSYSGQTHRLDSALNVYCGTNTTATGDVGFQNPKWAAGLYKYTWRNGAKTQATSRLGYLDNIYWAEDTTLNGSAAALVGGTGSLGGDTTPPVITHGSTAVTSNSAVITYTTNEPTTGIVNYGLTTGYGSNVVDGVLGTTHQYSITGLTPGTAYQFRERATDAAGNETIGPNLSFQTSAASLAVTNVTVTSVGQTTATVNWTTSGLSDSLIDYGPTTAYGSNKYHAGLVTSHTAVLTGLTPSTDYQYRITSVGAGGTAISGNLTFKTLSAISSVTAVPVSPTSHRITWTTSQSTIGVVNYGLTSSYSAAIEELQSTTNHSVLLTGLTANTDYHYLVLGSDGIADIDRVFRTLSAPPAGISGIGINRTQNSLTITWTTAEPTDSTMYIGKSLNYELTPVSDTAYVTSHSLTKTGLLPSNWYNIKLRSANATGAAVESGNITAFTRSLSGGRSDAFITPP